MLQPLDVSISKSCNNVLNCPIFEATDIQYWRTLRLPSCPQMKKRKILHNETEVFQDHTPGYIIAAAENINKLFVE